MNASVLRIVQAASVLWVVLVARPVLRAQMGVVVVEDIPAELNWMQEEMKWEQVIANTRAEVQNTDTLIRRTDTLIDRGQTVIDLMGQTATAVHRIVQPVGETMKSVEVAADLETEKHALDSSRNLFPPGSRNIRLQNPGNRIEKTFDAFGHTLQRENGLYDHFAQQEAMYGRYRTAAGNEETVVREETERQRTLLERLAAATTESEVAVATAALTASKLRLALAHQKTLQAKSDLDAFRGQLTYEEGRKATADREWARAIVDRMREKALANYQAQLGGGRATADP